MITYKSDILEKGLDVIFCGLNPALSAAVAGHNFSHRNNRFWAVLHLAGFTDVRLHPENERRLLEYGCGITAIIHRPTRRAEEIRPEEFRKARSSFEVKMRDHAPRSIAFLGKRGFSIMTGQPDVDWGRYPSGLAERWRGYFPIQVASAGASRSGLSCVRIRNFAWLCPNSPRHRDLMLRERGEEAVAKKFRGASGRQSPPAGRTHEAGYRKTLSPRGGEQPCFHPPTWSDEHRTLA